MPIHVIPSSKYKHNQNCMFQKGRCADWIKSFFVPGYGQRCDRCRFRIILSIIGSMHRQLASEYQLSLPLETITKNILRIDSFWFSICFSDDDKTVGQTRIALARSQRTLGVSGAADGFAESKKIRIRILLIIKILIREKSMDKLSLCTHSYICVKCNAWLNDYSWTYWLLK